MKISFNKAGKIGLLVILITCTCSCHINARKTDKKLTGYAVFQKYIKAIGGERNLRSVKSSIVSCKSYKNNKLFCTRTRYTQYPNKVAFKLDYATGSIVWVKFDGKKEIEIRPAGVKREIKGNDKLLMKQIAYVFPELYYIDYKYSFKIAGEDKNEYKIEISNGKNFKTYYYIDKSSFLCTKILANNMMDFFVTDTVIDHISMPYLDRAIPLSSPKDTFVTITEFYKINPKINDTIFEIK